MSDRTTPEASPERPREREGDDAGDRRDDPRAPITLRVDYKRLNTFFADYTKNISSGGTFIRTSRPLGIGTEFMFVLALPTESSTEVALRGVVRWVVEEKDATEENPAGMGIQFVYVDDEERRHVESLVAELMKTALGPALAEKLLAAKPGD